MGNLCGKEHRIVPADVAQNTSSSRQQAGKGRGNRIVPVLDDSPQGTPANASFSRWPALRDLDSFCTKLQPSSLQHQLSSISSLAGACLKTLQGTASSIPPATAQAIVRSCCQCLDRLLQPLISSTTESLGENWDTLTPLQLHTALIDAAERCFPGQTQPLQWLGAALAPLTALLQWWHAHGRRLLQPGTQQDTALSVPALDAVVSMLGVAFFKRVVLDTQATLQARRDAVYGLSKSLAWSTTQLAACASPAQRAVLLAACLPAADGRGERRVKLTVRRGRAFWDALRAAQDQRLLQDSHSGTSQPCKLFPSFVDEMTSNDTDAKSTGANNAAVEAGEGHGPRKEFFLLAAASVMDTSAQQGHSTAWGPAQDRGSSEPALLVFNRSAGACWFNTALQQSQELISAYEFLGWLAAQSILNRAPLGCPLPSVLFDLILQGERYKPTLAALAAFDPDAAKNVQKAASLPAKEFKAMLELESLPPSLTPHEYTQRAVHDLLWGQVQWQAKAMASGFTQVIGTSALDEWCVGAEELAVAVSGTDASAQQEQDLRTVFRVVVDGEFSEGSEGSHTLTLLWDVLTAWPTDKRLQFVDFVTGSKRLPLPGSELLKIECPFLALNAAQKAAMLQTLPQAHTCDNLLELPNYWGALLEARHQTRSSSGLSPSELTRLRDECRGIIEDRLTLALTGCAGYGLDERD